MMPKNNFFFKVSPMLAIMFSLPFLITSCGIYMDFSTRNMVANCFFEYPLPYLSLHVDRTVTDMTIINGSRPDFSKQQSPSLGTLLSVIGFKTNVSFPGYLSYLEWDLGHAKQGQSDDEFKLVERSIITVDNVSGEKIIYQYVRHSDPLVVEETKQIPAISYEAYFENNGLLWNIQVSAITERANQAKADFEHIIKTFKFLD